MKNGRSLVELATEIQRRAGAKHDYVARAEALNMEVLDPVLEKEFDKILGREPEEPKRELRLKVGDERFALNEITHDQIGGYLQIPAAYYDRMRQDCPELLAANINTWLA